MAKAIGGVVSLFLALAGVFFTILGDWPAQQVSQETGVTVLEAKVLLCIAVPVVVIVFYIFAIIVTKKSFAEGKHVTVPPRDVYCWLLKSYRNAIDYLEKIDEELTRELKPNWRNRRVHASSLRGLEQSGLLDVPPYIMDSADASLKDNHIHDRTKALEELSRIRSHLYWKIWIPHEVAINSAATMARKLRKAMSRSVDEIKVSLDKLDRGELS